MWCPLGVVDRRSTQQVPFMVWVALLFEVSWSDFGLVASLGARRTSRFRATMRFSRIS